MDAAVAVIIFYGSLVTVPETTINDLCLTFIQPSHWRHVVVDATLAAAYGIAMETGQAFLPHRTPFLVTDVLVNTLGASLVILWFLVRPHLELRPLDTFLSTAGDR